jgi:biopolymer transport protein ExbD
MIDKRSDRLTPMQEIPTASLADISFLLLIFFLSTTMFAMERGIPLVLPGAGSATVKVKRSSVVVVAAKADGTITVDKSPVPLGRLRTVIENKLAQNSDLIVVLETEPRSEYGLMVDILDELRLADARRISLKSTEAAK